MARIRLLQSIRRTLTTRLNLLCLSWPGNYALSAEGLAATGWGVRWTVTNWCGKFWWCLGLPTVVVELTVSNDLAKL